MPAAGIVLEPTSEEQEQSQALPESMDLLLQRLLQPLSGSHPAYAFSRGSTGWESCPEFNLLSMARAQRVERREGTNSRDVGTCWHGEGTFCAWPGQLAQGNQWRA